MIFSSPAPRACLRAGGISAPNGFCRLGMNQQAATFWPASNWASAARFTPVCGSVATSGGIWASWLPVLAPHHRIVRFDTRGFGRSHEPGRPVDWTLDRFADDILEVAAAAGAERFHLVGESMGGTVCLALALATRADAPLLSLTCVSTSHRGASIQRVGSWRERATREGMAAWSAQMMDDRFVAGVLPVAAWRWFSDVQQRTAVENLLDAADMLVRTDLSDALHRIAVPTLLLAPDSSPFLALEIPSDIHRLVPGSEVAVFPGVRHGLAFSHGEECATLLLDFLARRLGRRLGCSSRGAGAARGHRSPIDAAAPDAAAAPISPPSPPSAPPAPSSASARPRGSCRNRRPCSAAAARRCRASGR